MAMGLGACARMPGPEAGGTPVAQVAATGFAAVQAGGTARGAAVAFDECHVMTCAHVLPGDDAVVLRRGPDGAEVRPLLLRRSRRMDLAVMRVPAGFLLPPPQATDAPLEGEEVWAAGAPALGSPVARGVVEAPDAVMPGFGRGFTARMPAPR
ncbi:trypsin-like peptidase domain-containing protein [Roseomonas marmotae]|uniref:Trypsin-like peptidase domain-containing protein n=1 Tax=Roseomonas marmotae TaxID=2768161 RepID=A0ABS3KFR9_9PROT|nr:trypsin-like peptidase domain-containing protein [Roseomonas marmotae]MBO1076319.1 trypsin-like peptidase domain-containing protein [Roseomonas marmotae]